MNKELEQKLYEKYPKLFRQAELSTQESCMGWGCTCSNGWYNIIDLLCSNIQHHIDWRNCGGEYESHKKTNKQKLGTVWVIWKRYLKLNWYRVFWLTKELVRLIKIQYAKQVPQVEFVQIKEKFGTLRVYYSGGDDKIDGMVRLAESISGVTCEECAAPGETGGSYYIRTLCDECREKRNGQ